jgi:hypothetical protein
MDIRAEIGELSILSGLAEHDFGDACEGLEFSIEGDASDAIDSSDVSVPNNAEDDFWAADEGEGLSDHTRPPLPCGKATLHIQMYVSADMRDWA